MTTHIWNTAVRALADLRLVEIDEDSGVAEGTTAAVAGDRTVLDPADRLLVNEVDSSEWTRL